MAILFKYDIFRVQQGQLYMAQMKSREHVVIKSITHDWHNNNMSTYIAQQQPDIIE